MSHERDETARSKKREQVPNIRIVTTAAIFKLFFIFAHLINLVVLGLINRRHDSYRRFMHFDMSFF
jgi:hypothetical protein